MNFSRREENMLAFIAILLMFLITVCVWYWGTGDDYQPAYRTGYCAAQDAKFVSPNLCMDGDRVVSVWTE
jgi:hypothetical protein